MIMIDYINSKLLISPVHLILVVVATITITDEHATINERLTMMVTVTIIMHFDWVVLQALQWLL